MERAYKCCQSCGTPMKRDGGGTHADGTRSTMYCSHCFKEGSFTVRNISVDDMKERVKGKYMAEGFPRFLTGFFTRNLHKLERWKIHPLAVE
jgi:hypothetical protein